MNAAADLRQPVNILLVEDDDVDVEAVTRMMEKRSIANPFFRARDGQEALEYLRGQMPPPPISVPCLVLLDINMPRMNGFALLSEMRRDAQLSQNVVYMLTTSRLPRDQKKAADLGAAGFISKDSPEALAKVLEEFCPPAQAC